MAKKPAITTIASGYYSRQALNNNFENLQAGFDNTLSLDGSTPNAMGADLDINGNNILNAGQIDTDTLLIGGVAVSPSGDVNFETTYLTASYIGDGSTVAYSLTANPQTENNVNVYVDGVYQNKNTFALSGTTVTFSEAPPLNAAIEIVYPTNTDTLNGSAASAITYNQGGIGAQDRTVEAKLQETVSVKDFGAVGDGVTDDTAAFNLATLYADTSYASGSNLDTNTQKFIREVFVPAGVYRIDGKVYIRKGMHLRGVGQSSQIVTQFNAPNGGFVLGGTAASGTFVADPGGLPSAISGLYIAGGQPAVQVEGAGSFVSDMFFNAPASTGVVLNGSDTLVSNCIFDLGSTHIGVNGSGNRITDCVFYFGNTNIVISDDDTTAIAVSNCTFEFSKIAAFRVTGDRCYNLKINDCVFFDSGTGGFTDGAVVFDGNTSTCDITACKFRNINSWAIRHINGSGATFRVQSSSFDGRTNINTKPTAANSGGVYVNGNIIGSISDCRFEYLTGQPILFDDALGADATMYVKDCIFDQNTGGTADIQIDATRFNSLITLMDVKGSDRLLFNYDAAANCDVDAHDLVNWLDAPTDDGTYLVWTVPFVGSTPYEYSIVTNTSPSGNSRYRQIETGLIAVEMGEIASVLSTQVTKAASYTSSGLSEAAISLASEMTTVGSGSSVAFIDRGNFVLRIPNNYVSTEMSVSPIRRSKKST